MSISKTEEKKQQSESRFGKYGIIGIMRECIIIMAGWVKKIFVGSKNSAHEELYVRWKEMWQSERDLYMRRDDDVFFVLFVDTFQSVKRKKQSNKRKNFWFKFIFISFVFVFLILCAYILFQQNINHVEEASILENGYLTILLVLSSACISKWINIKKYQETWARHSTHMHRLEMEMYKYVEHFEPYETYPGRENNERHQMFIRNILKIWGDNQVKFTSNIENKEANLMDVFKHSNLNQRT